MKFKTTLSAVYMATHIFQIENKQHDTLVQVTRSHVDLYEPAHAGDAETQDFVFEDAYNARVVFAEQEIEVEHHQATIVALDGQSYRMMFMVVRGIEETDLK